MAGIAGVATVAAASIPALFTHRRSARDVRSIKDTLGTKNGQGDVVAMLEHLKAWTIRHEGRHDVLERQIDDLRNGK